MHRHQIKSAFGGDRYDEKEKGHQPNLSMTGEVTILQLYSQPTEPAVQNFMNDGVLGTLVEAFVHTSSRAQIIQPKPRAQEDAYL